MDRKNQAGHTLLFSMISLNGSSAFAYYQKSVEEQLDTSIPEFSQEIIYSFLGNTLMYLIDDCYRRLTVDTGIPFRKTLKLDYPTMRIDAYLQ